MREEGFEPSKAQGHVGLNDVHLTALASPQEYKLEIKSSYKVIVERVDGLKYNFSNITLNWYLAFF